MMFKNPSTLFALVALVAPAAPAAPIASAPQGGYLLPPPEVVEIIDAVPNPSMRFSLDKRWALALQGSSMPTIADISRPMLRLAGMRIDPRANSAYRTSFYGEIALSERGILKPARQVALPEGARVSTVMWSHDSEHLAFIVESANGSNLYGSTATEIMGGAKPKLLLENISTVTGGPRWMRDGSSLLCQTVPKDRDAEPERSTVPQGPNVQEAEGDTSPLRTYQDLLSDEHDVALFDHYCTSQLVLVNLDDGTKRSIGQPAIFAGVSVAPGGEQLLVTRVHAPYSYLMPWYRFPQTIAVWNLKGETLHTVAEVPLAEGIPLGGVRLGRRSIAWIPHEGAGLMWVEALDGGDPKREVKHRDRWMTLTTPYNGEPTELTRTEHRSTGISFLEDPELFIASEYDRKRRWTRSTLHKLGSTEPGKVLDDRSSSDRYGNPGSLVSRRDHRGIPRIRVDGKYVYRTGSGASPEGMLPFLDRQNLETLETERLWRCEPGAYESVSSLLDSDGEGLRFMTRHETPDSPSNYRERQVGSEKFVAQTAFQHPAPQLQGIHKELVTYEREDGVPLSATLYLPANYEKGTRLPLLVWAYPREFSDPKLAGQVSSSPSRFTRIGGLSHLVLLTQGYAIMDGATMPVIGDPETMNDTFVEQIVAAAQAAIDKAVDMGVADRDAVVVGGHSYGAFMTANLLAHCDLFVTGVARSGAYNRTLTPFGFQSERRTFWEAPDAYFNVSPFMHAHKINEPLLMIHGEIDNNSGTFPMQSERLFQAIKGNGGTARLVMLPAESHGYRARESVLHVHAETIRWFDRFLKTTGRPVEASDR
jgi:dipeptidyl aminopeptidase/acylaminoacyl peptidase